MGGEIDIVFYLIRSMEVSTKGWKEFVDSSGYLFSLDTKKSQLLPVPFTLCF